jgi:prepilin-type N-terminal cleavage/methylation domain-containing protein
MTRHSAFAKFRFPLRTTRGVTLIELMIVFVIIGIMLSFLFPAIQAVRQSSLRTSCQNNRHNLEIAIENYIAATKRFPGPPIEDRLLLNLPLSDPSNLQAGGGRPDVFRCPLVVVTDSAVPGIPTAHYTLAVDQTTRGKNAKKVAWRLRDASVGTRLPWCLGPEVTFHDPYEHPHPAPESGLGSLVGD